MSLPRAIRNSLPVTIFINLIKHEIQRKDKKIKKTVVEKCKINHKYIIWQTNEIPFCARKTKGDEIIVLCVVCFVRYGKIFTLFNFFLQ